MLASDGWKRGLASSDDDRVGTRAVFVDQAVAQEGRGQADPAQETVAVSLRLGLPAFTGYDEER